MRRNELNAVKNCGGVGNAASSVNTMESMDIPSDDQHPAPLGILLDPSTSSFYEQQRNNFL